MRRTRVLSVIEEILVVMKEIRFNLALVAGELHKFNQREDLIRSLTPINEGPDSHMDAPQEGTQ